VVDPYAIILNKLLEKVDPLMDDAIPGLALLVFEGSLPKRSPFLEELCGAIVSLEISSQRHFETTPERHRGTCFFLSPTVQVTMPVAARAAKVLSDLSVAIDHHGSVARASHRLIRTKSLASPPPGQRLQGSGKTDRSSSREMSEQFREGRRPLSHPLGLG
jgi:hypothetical protein